MIIPIDLILLVMVVILAILTIDAKDLFVSVTLLSIYSFLMAIVWAEMHSVDVSFTEAAVGAGITTAFFIATLTRIPRKEK